MESITLAEAIKRIQALNQFSEETGVELPYRPGFIVRQELEGNTVDLETGAIVIGGANQAHAPTQAGLEGGA